MHKMNYGPSDCRRSQFIINPGTSIMKASLIKNINGYYAKNYVV